MERKGGFEPGSAASQLSALILNLFSFFGSSKIFGRTWESKKMRSD
jgi:hypothetical protein